MRLILLIVLIAILLGALPLTPWAANWGTGYWPSGTALIIIIAVLLFL